MPLIHAERDPDLDCRPVVMVPAPLTRDEAELTLQAASETKAKALAAIGDADLIDDLANALRKAWDANAGLARYPVSDPVWGDLARVAIERVRAVA